MLAYPVTASSSSDSDSLHSQGTKLAEIIALHFTIAHAYSLQVQEIETESNTKDHISE
jgi:hypothetical protein